MPQAGTLLVHFFSKLTEKIAFILCIEDIEGGA